MRFFAAIAATEAPAASEPVSATARTRSSPRICSEASWAAKALTMSPSGPPASANSLSISSADWGTFEACLRTRVLPAASWGAPMRTTW